GNGGGGRQWGAGSLWSVAGWGEATIAGRARIARAAAIEQQPVGGACRFDRPPRIAAALDGDRKTRRARGAGAFEHGLDAAGMFAKQLLDPARVERLPLARGQPKFARKGQGGDAQ